MDRNSFRRQVPLTVAASVALVFMPGAGFCAPAATGGNIVLQNFGPHCLAPSH